MLDNQVTGRATLISISISNSINISIRLGNTIIPRLRGLRLVRRILLRSRKGMVMDIPSSISSSKGMDMIRIINSRLLMALVLPVIKTLERRMSTS